MEEGETVSILSRKELRKQKLIEYLAAKGKLKPPNPKVYLRDDCPIKKPVKPALMAAMGKENKVPDASVRYEGTKVQSLPSQSTKCPSRRAFGVTNKVNGKGNAMTGRHNDSCVSATRGPAKPNLNLNPVLRSTYNVISFKSNLNAATNIEKQPNTGMRPSAKASSNACDTAILRLKSRSITTSNAARMSLGPVVKTKTGLIPAVTQPRSTNSHLTHVTATAPDNTTIANKVIYRTSSSVPVSQRSVMAPRKTLSTVVNNPVNKRTTLSVTAGTRKVQDQNKSNLKPLLVKQSQSSCKGQISSGLKSASVFSKYTAPPIKPEGKVGISKTNQSAGRSTVMTTKQRSEGKGEKNDKLRKVTSQTSLRPSTKCSSTAVSGVTRGAVAEPGDKTIKYKETQNKKGQSSANVPPQQKVTKRTGISAMSQTVPQPARTISLTRKPTEMKTPKLSVRVIPQTEGKKLTAAQEERMRKLQEWREAKGISYKRPPMPVKPQVRRTVAVPQPYWSTMKEEDEAHSLICAVDKSLADCIKLLGEGCPPDQVKEVLARLPTVSQKFAKYWICQARLMEQEGNLDVLPMFEEAVRVVLEPVDELRNVVFEILKKKDELRENEKDEHHMSANESTGENCSTPVITPKPVRALIRGERGDSSIVKYKITVTPGGPPSQQREPARVNGQEVRFFTPVRRSVRIERASLRYPTSLQDHDLCVASYNDLMSEEDKEKSQEQEGGKTSPSIHDTPMYIFRQNEALKDKVLVELLGDEEVQS